MRFLIQLVSLALFLCIIVFVLQNRTNVEISFWPFDLQASLPVSILSLILLVAGYLLGVASTSLPLFRAIRRGQKLEKQIKGLNQKISENENTLKTGCVPTILVGGRYQPFSLPPRTSVEKTTFWSRYFMKGKRP